MADQHGPEINSTTNTHMGLRVLHEEDLDDAKPTVGTSNSVEKLRVDIDDNESKARHFLVAGAESYHAQLFYSVRFWAGVEFDADIVAQKDDGVPQPARPDGQRAQPRPRGRRHRWAPAQGACRAVPRRPGRALQACQEDVAKTPSQEVQDAVRHSIMTLRREQSRTHKKSAPGTEADSTITLSCLLGAAYKISTKNAGTFLTPAIKLQYSVKRSSGYSTKTLVVYSGHGLEELLDFYRDSFVPGARESIEEED